MLRKKKFTRKKYECRQRASRVIDVKCCDNLRENNIQIGANCVTPGVAGCVAATDLIGVVDATDVTDNAGRVVTDSNVYATDVVLGQRLSDSGQSGWDIHNVLESAPVAVLYAHEVHVADSTKGQYGVVDATDVIGVIDNSRVVIDSNVDATDVVGNGRVAATGVIDNGDVIGNIVGCDHQIIDASTANSDSRAPTDVAADNPGLSHIHAYSPSLLQKLTIISQADDIIRDVDSSDIYTCSNTFKSSSLPLSTDLGKDIVNIVTIDVLVYMYTGDDFRGTCTDDVDPGHMTHIASQVNNHAGLSQFTSYSPSLLRKLMIIDNTAADDDHRINVSPSPPQFSPIVDDEVVVASTTDDEDTLSVDSILGKRLSTPLILI